VIDSGVKKKQREQNNKRREEKCDKFAVRPGIEELAVRAGRRTGSEQKSRQCGSRQQWVLVIGGARQFLNRLA